VSSTNTVDASTGTIRLKATFANEARILWPGQFVNVTLTLGKLTNAVVVPAEAVQPGTTRPDSIHRQGGSNRGAQNGNRWPRPW
jgi:multidrug efflux system membrane fusion protein